VFAKIAIKNEKNWIDIVESVSDPDRGPGTVRG
jgi:hypothetical protein